MTVAADLLPLFDHEMSGVRRVLERVPAERFDWRPHPKSFTVGELAIHLARIPGWVGGMLEQDHYDLAENAARTKAATLPASTNEMLALFDANRAAARASIEARTDAELAQPWELRRAGAVLRTMPRAALLRAFLLDHVIHHRGQMTVYLRLLDVPVPGLYGPSADELA
jgi:uncharacterized damage-inducible protein DinB